MADKAKGRVMDQLATEEAADAATGVRLEVAEETNWETTQAHAVESDEDKDAKSNRMGVNKEGNDIRAELNDYLNACHNIICPQLLER